MNISTNTGKHYRVVANHNATIVVQDESGLLQRCVARRKLGTIVAGDWVEIESQATGRAAIADVLPRSGVLERPTRRGEFKPVAANLSRLLVVSAPRPGIDTLLIDSYCAAAEIADIQPAIIINKSDLIRADDADEVENLLKDYRRIGYQCLLLNTLDNSHMDILSKLLSGETSVLVGQSGVGKSSIINCLLPEKSIRTGELSAATGLGGHTTTATTLYNLPGGGHLIDSPGVRDFALGTVSHLNLAKAFREFVDYAEGCRFSNCIHQNEPGCAVQQAVTDNFIARSRYQSYLKLMEKST